MFFPAPAHVYGFESNVTGAPGASDSQLNCSADWWCLCSARGRRFFLPGSNLQQEFLGVFLPEDSAGPAVILLMISLFCRKSWSPGESGASGPFWRETAPAPAPTSGTRGWAFIPAGPRLARARPAPLSHQYHPSQPPETTLYSPHKKKQTILSFHSEMKQGALCSATLEQNRTFCKDAYQADCVCVFPGG